MSTRYISNALIALLGGLVVVISVSLAAPTVAWVAFGIAIGVVAISLLSQLDSRRGMTQRLLDLALVSLGGTLIGVSVVFGGPAVAWLAFALALGFVGTAFAGLTLHEIAAWRAVHNLSRLHGLGAEESMATEAGGLRREVQVPPRAA